MKSLEINNFEYGIINSIEDTSIPRGAASDSLNWTTEGDHIALRRGMKRIGAEVTGLGKVTGLHTGQRADGTDVTWKTYLRKILWYDTGDADDWDEIGTDTLPAGASAEDVAFSDYASLAGNQVWASSPNSSIYKIMTANPDSISDMSSTTFRGYIRIKQNRMFLWHRTDDLSGIYGSWIDAQTTTAVSAESVGTGDGTTKTFTHTFAFKAGGAKRTCYGVSVTDAIETFSDDYNGVLTGDKGGTGTVNYTTGAISVTFNTAPTNLQAITGDLNWEDSTDDGLADFTYSATRVAGEGFVFRQDSGGTTMGIASLADVEYCLHEKMTYTLTLTADDTNATNLIYRGRVGIPNWRSWAETGEGIYYLDNTDEKDPKVRLLRYQRSGDKVIPAKISENIDLTDYRFNDSALFEWGDYIIVACRHKDETYNNTLWAYSRKYKSWDRHDYWARCFTINNGNLWSGDSISKNVWELFSGLDDDGALIPNYWEGNLDKLQLRQLKKLKKLVLEGNIGPDQSIKVSLSYDNTPFVEVGTIDGSGSYVDKGQKVNVGSMTVGTSEVGGGGGDISAYHYERELTINSDKFEKVKIRFEATELGWADVSRIMYKDIRKKAHKVPTKYN